MTLAPTPRTSTTALMFLLGRLERLNERLVAEICRRHHLAAGDLRVLTRLDLSGQVATSPSQLARSIVQTSGGLTATLTRLEKAGLIVRLDDPDDGRGRLVQLTPAGAEVSGTVTEQLLDRYSSAFDATDIDVEQALTTVAQLVNALERDAELEPVDLTAIRRVITSSPQEPAQT